MKIIEPYHEHISKKGLTPYQFIEKIGRTCYKSEDKITQDSAVKFVQGLCKRQHYAMIEHHWVHIMYRGLKEEFVKALDIFARHDCFTKGESYDLTKHMEITFAGNVFISAPLRVFFELIHEGVLDLNTDPIPSLIDEMLSAVTNKYPEIFPIKMTYRITHNFKVMDEDTFCRNLYEDMAGYCNEEQIDKELVKHITHTVKFVCDRGVSHELVRHRPCNFAQESTRYCNYSKSQFDGEVTFILPFYLSKDPTTTPYEALYPKGEDAYGIWHDLCHSSEIAYNNLLNHGCTPQEARSVLPNSLKTEIIMTANEKEWQHIVDLRAKGTTGAPHPQMKEIMYPWYEELKELTEGRIK